MYRNFVYRNYRNNQTVLMKWVYTRFISQLRIILYSTLMSLGFEWYLDIEYWVILPVLGDIGIMRCFYLTYWPIPIPPDRSWCCPEDKQLICQTPAVSSCQQMMVCVGKRRFLLCCNSDWFLLFCVDLIIRLEGSWLQFDCSCLHNTCDTFCDTAWHHNTNYNMHIVRYLM